MDIRGVESFKCHGGLAPQTVDRPWRPSANCWSPHARPWALVAGAVAVGLALTGCDSGQRRRRQRRCSTEPAGSSPGGPTNTYVVDAGDTLSGIAAGYGLSLSELVEVNEWTDGSNHAIFPGDVIALPDDAVAVLDDPTAEQRRR